MEWEKAKTILIIVFLLLNAGLFAMNLGVSESYKMTPEEAAKITKLLSDNEITLNCEIPPRNKPRRLIAVSAAAWDYDYIKATFFPNEQNVTRTNEEGNVIYNSPDGASVTVTNARAGNNDSELIYYEPIGTKAADGYKRQLGKQFEQFELKRLTVNENGETYLYNETLKNDVIFSSGVEVTFLKGGGVTVRVRKYDFVSYVEGIHDIFRADEVLLTFSHYKNDNISESVVIEDIQFGYEIDTQTIEKTRKAKPCYRIFVEGIPEAVVIDALMNTVL